MARLSPNQIAYYALRYKVLERDQFTCQLCGAFAPEVRLEVDHILPVSQGGTDDEQNLRTTCYSCNRGRGDALRIYSQIPKKQDVKSKTADIIWETLKKPQTVSELAQSLGMSAKYIDNILRYNQQMFTVVGRKKVLKGRPQSVWFRLGV